MRSASPVPLAPLPLWLIDNVCFFMPPFVRLICHRTRADWSMEKSTQLEGGEEGWRVGGIAFHYTDNLLHIMAQVAAASSTSSSSSLHVVASVVNKFVR